MNINFDDRQNVIPDASPLRAPNVYESSKSVYNAERAGFAEIGRAAQNASEAIAQCGELLTRYDQETLRRNFVADKRSLDIEYAKYYQEERVKLRNDPNQPQTVAEFQDRMSQINDTVRSRIIDWKQKNFRNYDRWEEELDGIAEAQAGNAMLKATEDWLGEQNRIEAQKFSNDLSFFVKNGTVEDVDNAVRDASTYNPAWESVYKRQGEAAKAAISARDLSATIASGVNSHATAANAELTIAIEKANESEEVDPDTPESGSRQEQLLWREKKDATYRQKQKELQAKYYEAAQLREESVFNDVSSKIDSNPYLNNKQKEQAKKTLRGQLREQTAAVWQQYKNIQVLEQQERTAKVKESLYNGDVDRLSEFRHISTDDSVLNGEDPNESAFKFIGDMAESQKHKTAAFIAISSLNPGSAAFGDEVVKILEEARLRGVTKEDYSQIMKTVSDMSAGRVKMDEKARNGLNAFILSKINESYGTEFKTLNEATNDKLTSPIVDEMVFRLSEIGYTIDDYSTAHNIISGAFAEAIRADDEGKTLERSMNKLREMVMGANSKRKAYRENPEGFAAMRAEKTKQRDSNVEFDRIYKPDEKTYEAGRIEEKRPTTTTRNISVL